MNGQLTRSASDKILAGVCGGVGAFFGIDVTIVRIIWAVLTLFTGFPIAIYVILWLVVPVAGGGTGVDDIRRAFGGRPPSDLR